MLKSFLSKILNPKARQEINNNFKYIKIKNFLYGRN